MKKYICSSCGYESQKWMGRCPECQNWNTFQEMTVVSTKQKKRILKELPKLTPIAQIKTQQHKRISTGFEEFDRVLGGGILTGEMILLSGDPGIGKSTLLLQVALHIAIGNMPIASSNKKESVAPLDNNSPHMVLYITGEESEDQVKMRAERLIGSEQLQKAQLFILSTTNIDAVVALLEEQTPTLVIIDSIQTMESEEVTSFPGSIPQIRHATGRLVEVAKRRGIPIVLVGHVTKEGIVAGPMLLSHMVDCVLYLEGEKLSGMRILRAFKNRFGDVSEVGIFMMEEKGLGEIQNVGSFFMQNKTAAAGSCATVVMEGSRPLLVEIQALTVPSSLSFPRRVVTGISDKRVELLLAVIQKHGTIPLERLDVFINVVGGFKIVETASDLAICLAIISSYRNKPLPSTAAISEIGLLGEVRSVMNLEKRSKEAIKFGFKTVLSAKYYKTLKEVLNEIKL